MEIRKAVPDEAGEEVHRWLEEIVLPTSEVWVVDWAAKRSR